MLPNHCTGIMNKLLFTHFYYKDPVSSSLHHHFTYISNHMKRADPDIKAVIFYEVSEIKMRTCFCISKEKVEKTEQC